MLNLENIPRKLNDGELQLIFKLLPSKKEKYAAYRNYIIELYLIGVTRFGDGNYILAAKNDSVDVTSPASNIFANGIVETNRSKYDISIHEIFENQIELDFISRDGNFVNDNEQIISTFTYSNWEPGDKSPITNESVKEIHLIKNEIIIAISESEKKIWVHEKESGYNSLIPLTNFYNEIIRVKGERNPDVALNQQLFFERPELFSDEEIAQGFLLYNKFMKKINLDYSIFRKDNNKNKKQPLLKKIFGLN